MLPTVLSPQWCQCKQTGATKHDGWLRFSWCIAVAQWSRLASNLRVLFSDRERLIGIERSGKKTSLAGATIRLATSSALQVQCVQMDTRYSVLLLVRQMHYIITGLQSYQRRVFFATDFAYRRTSYRTEKIHVYRNDVPQELTYRNFFHTHTSSPINSSACLRRIS